jgi:DNA-binding GntR family transcriptional regulator
MASEEPLYRRIADDLRGQIVSGGRPPGSQLPAESDLAARYDTTRQTVRNALGVLRTDGLIVTGQGSRTIVRPAPGVRISVTGTNYRRHRALGLPPGMPVIRTLRTVYDAGNRPLEVQDTVAVADKHQFRYEVDMR